MATPLKAVPLRRIRNATRDFILLRGHKSSGPDECGLSLMPDTDLTLSPDAPADMAARAAEAAAFLKTLAHEGRLMILCHLAAGERSVGELEALLNLRQAAVSQMLARLRDEGVVSARRDGKTVYYRLASSTTAQIVGFLHDIYCKDE